MLSFKEGLQFVSSENQGLPHGPPPKEDGDNNNNNNDDDSEDYAHDNYLSHLISRQQHRERVLIGELEAVKRENKLIQSIRSLRRERDTLLEKERAWQQERLTLTNKLRKFRPETSLPVGGKDAAEAAPVTSLLEPEQAVSAPSDIQEGVYKPAQPKLNYVDWPIFKSLRKRSEGDSFAIDVLQGEPDDEPIIAVHLSQPLVPERIRINSRHIIRILDHISGEALSAYGGSVVMTRPFKFLAYYKEAIQQKFSELKHRFESDNTSVTQQLASDANAETGFVDSNGDEFTESLVAYEQLRCLIAFMDAEVRLKVHHHSWGGGKAVAFADMWYLFKPGDEVTSRDCRQVYRVVGTSSPGHPVLPSWNGNDIETNDKMVKTAITLRCVYIDFDGNQLGPVSQVFQITPFDGTRAITSLEVFPIRYADHIDHQELITRGRRFLHALNAKYMYYTGRTIEPQETVHSHVVVDFEAALARDHGGVDGGWQPKIQSILGHTTLPKIADRVCRGACCLGENVYRDNDFDAKRNQEYIARMVSEDVTVSQPPSLILHPKPLHVLQSESGPADSELVVTTYRVLGFILKSRRWGTIYPLRILFEAQAWERPPPLRRQPMNLRSL
ncbi:hypothetical protein CHGG_00232 [Chaetomium globosum CBS 148.51]|uniref:DUF7025 domain-containing protein n=1 Tax=Chaetomium globosum (strain ATCC 6205 / CBS 148.51 / DSM 1962 / NBRC 6347 / NRRL 1970) TaxID=306901 RepID=Q2HHS2_CHAGB|nr:uncharacterized protein CHGG_00232 [Chaetomium globosum CBS 148.51]EAQ91997.1 hypothetical protein CHGG_00232 [Chaetomium globosum CBS 148.51]